MREFNIKFLSHQLPCIHITILNIHDSMHIEVNFTWYYVYFNHLYSENNLLIKLIKYI